MVRPVDFLFFMNKVDFAKQFDESTSTSQSGKLCRIKTRGAVGCLYGSLALAFASVVRIKHISCINDTLCSVTSGASKWYSRFGFNPTDLIL
jgi:hypothetical protein